MKTLRLLHPKHGICAQEIISRANYEDKIKRKWVARYGQIIKECTYEIYYSNPKPQFVIKNTKTGEIYENKEEAMKVTGLKIETINNILGRKKYYPYPYYLMYIKKEAI